MSSVKVELTDEEYENIEKELNNITIHGNRTDKDFVDGLAPVQRIKKYSNKIFISQ